jgi:hypothetical protein
LHPAPGFGLIPLQGITDINRMEIAQKRDASRTSYVFHEDRVEYSWKDSSGSRSFSVPYTEISRDRQGLTERNVWFRNAGILWLLIGGVQLAATWSGTQSARGGLWLILGAACVAVYRFRAISYTILPSEKGNLLVIDDADGRRILEEIEKRRAAQFRGEYDFFPQGDSPEQLRNRFNWLHREGALSEEELQQRLAAIHETSPEPVAEPKPATSQLLH